MWLVQGFCFRQSRSMSAVKRTFRQVTVPCFARGRYYDSQTSIQQENIVASVHVTSFDTAISAGCHSFKQNTIVELIMRDSCSHNQRDTQRREGTCNVRETVNQATVPQHFIVSFLGGRETKHTQRKTDYRY